MTRRIVHAESVDMAVTVDGETFDDRADVRALSRSDRTGPGRGRKVQIAFGLHTDPESPWYGDEPTLELTPERAAALRDALDRCLRAADTETVVYVKFDPTA
ncbi:hypothetical protein SCD75_00035 (plasmid) [Prescottella equi]|uniref:Uncharacterized protein n=1 Tax=Rhodococcus hoagii TaxID=43767 RepID=A0A1Z1UX44_RHOHA|nr:hypothetical protein [Prescottella equi]ARX60048.1 hypothetical protein pVAPN1572_0080 [Prescottella equi]WQB72131.1 hypothetical protein SCD75_00035 [Prescottella equi]